MPALHKSKSRSPSSGAGLVRYYDVDEGGPKMDPKFVIGIVIGVTVLEIISKLILE